MLVTCIWVESKYPKNVFISSSFSFSSFSSFFMWCLWVNKNKFPIAATKQRAPAKRNIEPRKINKQDQLSLVLRSVQYHIDFRRMVATNLHVFGLFLISTVCTMPIPPILMKLYIFFVMINDPLKENPLVNNYWDQTNTI